MNKARAVLVLSLITLFSLVIIIRLVDIQIIKKEKYSQLAEHQQTAIEKIIPELGLIYDRNNNLLVYNRNDVTFYLDLNMVNNEDKIIIAKKFSSVIGKNKNYYLSLMNKSKKTIVLESKVQPEDFEKLKSFNHPALYYVSDPTRVYHYRSLASHILGFVNKENKFVSGVSEFFSKDLSGIEGYRKVYKNSLGRVVSFDENEMQEAIPGNNLFLTIDKRYQAILEEELKNGIEQFEAHSATGIIMDPNTGEILALSNLHDFDPNKYWMYDDFQRRNRAITDTYEPGSTFKPFVFAALIEKDLISLNQKIFLENGVFKFYNTTIRDVKAFSSLTVKDILVQSSNIGMSKLAQRIKDDQIYKFLRGFGFGNLTGIQIKGEATGNLKNPLNWTATTKSFISFGYEISVTPIQLITAFSALINGGYLYQPILLHKKTNFKHQLIEESKPILIRRVISESTSSIMRKILSEVVSEGTGKQAALEYISVGGKTGTSQKLVGGIYSKKHYNTVFIGFFPVEKPKIIILIHYNSPQVGKFGGLVSAPVFKRVAERIIEKDFSKFEKYVDDKLKQKLFASQINNDFYLNNFFNDSQLNGNQFKIMPNLINQSLDQALKTLK